MRSKTASDCQRAHLYLSSVVSEQVKRPTLDLFNSKSQQLKLLNQPASYLLPKKEPKSLSKTKSVREFAATPTQTKKECTRASYGTVNGSKRDTTLRTEAKHLLFSKSTLALNKIASAGQRRKNTTKTVQSKATSKGRSSL